VKKSFGQVVDAGKEAVIQLKSVNLKNVGITSKGKLDLVGHI
jgi:hypothetical protein